MKPEDTPSSSRRSETLAIGNSSEVKSRSPKITKEIIAQMRNNDMAAISK